MFLLGFAAAGSFFSASCTRQLPVSAAVPPTPTPTQVSFAYLYNTYINAPIGSSQQCSNCHSPGFPPDPTSASSFYNSVVNQPNNYGCGATFVVPGNAVTSTLYDRLSGNGGCTPQMPNGGPTYLTSAQLAQFAAWINEGAPNN